MAEVAKLTETAERLINICDKLLTLIHKNRTSCAGHEAHGYYDLWSETQERIEDLQLLFKD